MDFFDTSCRLLICWRSLSVMFFFFDMLVLQILYRMSSVSWTVREWRVPWYHVSDDHFQRSENSKRWQGIGRCHRRHECVKEDPVSGQDSFSCQDLEWYYWYYSFWSSSTRCGTVYVTTDLHSHVLVSSYDEGCCVVIDPAVWYQGICSDQAWYHDCGRILRLDVSEFVRKVLYSRWECDLIWICVY